MLYRILLVDDESEIRESIIKKISWEEIGFQVAADAENGQDALEKIEVFEPDVILTDIKMPYMDGLQLAEKIKYQYPAIKIIIFSGFDDFEYAQQAIKTNVQEYILKPIDAEELTKVLVRVKNSLDEEIANKRNIELLREKYLKNLPIIKEHFFLDLIHGKIEKDNILGALQEYSSYISGSGLWGVTNIKINNSKDMQKFGNYDFHKEEELLPISIKNIVNESLRDCCRFEPIQTSGNLLYIVGLEEGQSASNLLTILNHVSKECKKILGISITIGVGKIYDNLFELPKSYEESKDALGYEAIMGSGSIIYIEDVEPTPSINLQLDEKDENELILAVKFGREEDIKQVVNQIVSKVYQVKIHRRQYQTYVISIMNAITGLIQRYQIDDQSVFGKEIDYVEIMSELNDPEDLKSWLSYVTTKVSQNIYLERDNTMKTMIHEAKIYIQENYQNPELSVEMLCNHLHISPAYFSTLFKKETGKSYVGYLTEIRLNKAAELLHKTDDKTYVIASKVGYTEQNYFSYVFKKQFGVSPTKYRGN